VDPNCSCIDGGGGQGQPKGIAIAQDKILANFGWGAPGVIMNSADGAHWTNNYYFDGGWCYPNIAYGQGVFIHFSGAPHVSTDGINWQNAGFPGFNGPGQGWVNTRAFNFLNYQGGRFIGALDDNTFRVSSDAGNTWSVITPPAQCTDNAGTSNEILMGNGVAVMLTSEGGACRSADGGNTWTITPITTHPLNPAGAFANGQFLAWSTDGYRYNSPDGLTWAATAMTTSAWLGYVGVSPTGTLVSTNGLWSAYSGQQFLRSTDNGMTWQTLPVSKYTASHTILRFGAGMIKPNTLCSAK
jgi:hypothetical protein